MQLHVWLNPMWSKYFQKFMNMQLQISQILGAPNT
jgi:hypothetical protein